MSKDTIKPVKEEPTSTAHTEIGDVLTLVNEDDPEKLVFLPTVVESLKRQCPTVLSLKSHPGMALSYSKASNIPAWEPYYYVFLPCLVAVDSDTLRWKYEEDTYLSTMLQEDDNEDHDYVLSIDSGILEERRQMWLRREGNEKRTRQKEKSSFKINDNGSISPRDDPALFLGRSGETIKDERLIVAIGLGYNTAEIQAILAQDGIDVNAIAFSSCALSVACRKLNYELTEFLLKDYHANPNVNFSEHLATPLHRAANSGLGKFVKLFLKYGADPNSLNGNGSSPVTNAALCEKLNTMQLLLDDPEIDIHACCCCVPLPRQLG